MKIEDGTGSGKLARVDDNQRLYTDAITESIKDAETENGNAYNLNTGDVTLTSAAKTTVFYFKNNEDKDYHLTAFIYNLGNSTGGSGDVKMDVIKNPTTGDIITNANDVEMISNINYGSSSTLDANVYKGATGETVVNGDISISTRSASNTGRIFIGLGIIVVPKGSSIAVDYTPPSGNTSQTIQIAAAGYLKASVGD